MRKKLKEEEKKVTLTITITPILYNKIDELHSNKSKYIEGLIANDLLNNKHINEIP